MHLPTPITAEHVAFASAHLLELEAQHAPAEKRNEARRRWKALARHWRLQRMSEEQAADSRSVGEGSMPLNDMAPATYDRNRNRNGTHG